MKTLFTLTFVFYAALGFHLGTLIARADEIPLATKIPKGQIEAITADVRAYLILEGFTPSPTLFEAYETPLRGFSGLTIEGIAVVNSNRPDQCKRIDLGHEAVHILLGRLGLTPDQSEPFAHRWDEIASQDPFLPGCVGRLVVSRIAEVRP